MFLIEYREGCFIDGERVNWLEVKKGFVQCTLSGDGDTTVTVDEKYHGNFINNLQALNGNFSIESRYLEINKE